MELGSYKNFEEHGKCKFYLQITPSYYWMSAGATGLEHRTVGSNIAAYKCYLILNILNEKWR